MKPFKYNNAPYLLKFRSLKKSRQALGLELPPPVSLFS